MKTALAERFHKVLETHGQGLMRLSASYTKSSSDRDDLFQDIALAIWRALPSFRGESSERTFIFRIAQNRAMTHIAQRRPATAEDEGIDLADPRPNPEKGFAKGQQEMRLLDAIHRLPVEYRQVITLTLEDLSYSEIAAILGIGESNVGVRLNRARQMLRQLMEKDK
jgi:RNA polymerase sigma factor (sigma-70 family)